MIDREEAGWLLSRVWLDAMEETARDFQGTHPRVFCDRAYQHATENWIQMLAEEYGLRVEKALTMKEAVENYIALGVKAHLFHDQSDFRVEELSPDRLQISVLRCPYRDSCRDLLGRGFQLEDFTCPRIGCFAAAVRLLSGIPCECRLSGMQLDQGCEGEIERI